MPADGKQALPLRCDFQRGFDVAKQAVFFGVDTLFLFVVVEHDAVAFLLQLFDRPLGGELFLQRGKLPCGFAGFLDFLVELLDTDVEGDAPVFRPGFELFGFFTEKAFVELECRVEFLTFLFRQQRFEDGFGLQLGGDVEYASRQGQQAFRRRRIEYLAAIAYCGNQEVFDALLGGGQRQHVYPEFAGLPGKTLQPGVLAALVVIEVEFECGDG